MAKLLDRISQNLAKTGLNIRTDESRNWLKQNVKDLSVNQKSITDDKSRIAKTIYPGKMYFFFYDPKLKNQLPFYDRFPLVIPVEKYADGFLGLNLHYLPVKYRVILLDKLYDTLNNDKFDDTTKLRISYDLLSGAARYKEYAPCLKRYLNGHIQSRVISVEPSSWEIAIFLPVEKFVKQKASYVQKLSQESL
jgi:hypothetical protein